MWTVNFQMLKLDLEKAEETAIKLRTSIGSFREGDGTPLQYSCLENPMDGGAWWAAVHGVARSQTQLSDFTLFFHFHALEKEMATHSSVLAWRIPGMGEPGGLPSMGLHRVRHNWIDLAVAEAALDHWKSRRLTEKHPLLLYWLCQSLWLCGSQQTGKFLKRWEYRSPDLPPEKSVCRSRSNS